MKIYLHLWISYKIWDSMGLRTNALCVSLNITDLKDLKRNGWEKECEEREREW